MPKRPLKSLPERLNRHQMLKREVKMKERKLKEEDNYKKQEISDKTLNEGLLERLWRWLCHKMNLK